VLELAILGLLKERSMHGYQLKKSLSDALGPFWQVSYGSLYPALKRLQRQGAVEMVFPKEEVRRRKNVYRLTGEGERHFAELAQSAEGNLDENGFRVRMAFFRHLKPEARIGVMERRKAFLTDRLDALKARLARYTERVDNYTLSLMRHGMDTTEKDIAWLDDLIRQERRSVRRRRTEDARRGSGRGTS
jgi:DNA-binding PadR family transcriptional regulator